jgi:hypothetical protein
MVRCIVGRGQKRVRLIRRCLITLALALMAFPFGVGAQNRGVLSGQNVVPVYEGWQRMPDGVTYMWFGYFNRNFEEIVDIPIGSDNGFDAEVDSGQPTHFLARRQRFVFKVPLPGDWPKERRLTWSLTGHGKTERAQGWLQPEWEMDDGVIQMNMGPGGAPPDPPNGWPLISGSASLTARTDEAISLTARATDDGIPKPRRRGGNRASGLTIRWIQYRGPGRVTFSDPVTTGEYGQPVEATTGATFSAPGSYVVRAIASDGLLESPHAITVAVR